MSKYEFIKMGKRYLVINSNGVIVDEKTMLQMKNNELVLEDISSGGCKGTITKEISKNKKRIKEIEQETLVKDSVKFSDEPAKEPKAIIKETALEKEDAEDDTIKETTKSV